MAGSSCEGADKLRARLATSLHTAMCAPPNTAHLGNSPLLMETGTTIPLFSYTEDEVSAALAGTTGKSKVCFIWPAGE